MYDYGAERERRTTDTWHRCGGSVCKFKHCCRRFLDRRPPRPDREGKISPNSGPQLCNSPIISRYEVHHPCVASAHRAVDLCSMDSWRPKKMRRNLTKHHCALRTSHRRINKDQLVTQEPRRSTQWRAAEIIPRCLGPRLQVS